MISRAYRNVAGIQHVKYKLDRKTMDVLYTSYIGCYVKGIEHKVLYKETGLKTV